MGYTFEKDSEGYLINPNGRVLGYARVSTTKQHVDRQEIAMKAYGVRRENIIVEYESGKNFNRPLYRKMVKTLRRGDLVVILSLDRLGRNYQDIIDQWRLITQDIGCGIHVIDMPALNTSSDPEDLLSRFITDMMLQVLSFVADNERTSLLERQRMGIEAKKIRGEQNMGKPKLLLHPEFYKLYIVSRVYDFKRRHLIKYAEEFYGISQRSFYRKFEETEYLFQEYTPDELRKLDPMTIPEWVHLVGLDDYRNDVGIEFEVRSEEEIVYELNRIRDEMNASIDAKRAQNKRKRRRKDGRKRKRKVNPVEKKQIVDETIRTIIIE